MRASHSLDSSFSYDDDSLRRRRPPKREDETSRSAYSYDDSDMNLPLMTHDTFHDASSDTSNETSGGGRARAKTAAATATTTTTTTSASQQEGDSCSSLVDLYGVEASTSLVDWGGVLPEEILLACFKLLGASDLAVAALACKQWKLLAETPSLWERHAAEQWNLSEDNISALDTFRLSSSPAPSWRLLYSQWRASPEGTRKAPAMRRVTTASCSLDFNDRKSFPALCRRVRRGEEVFVLCPLDKSSMCAVLLLESNKVALVSKYNLQGSHTEEVAADAPVKPKLWQESRGVGSITSTVTAVLSVAALTAVLARHSSTPNNASPFAKWSVVLLAVLACLAMLLYCLLVTLDTVEQNGHWDGELARLFVVGEVCFAGASVVLSGLKLDGVYPNWSVAFTPIWLALLMIVVVPGLRLYANGEQESKVHTRRSLVWLYGGLPCLTAACPLASSVLLAVFLEGHLHVERPWFVIVAPLLVGTTLGGVLVLAVDRAAGQIPLSVALPYCLSTGRLLRGIRGPWKRFVFLLLMWMCALAMLLLAAFAFAGDINEFWLLAPFAPLCFMPVVFTVY